MSNKFLGVVWLFILSVFLFLPTIVYAEIFYQDNFESGNLSGYERYYDYQRTGNTGCNGSYSATSVIVPTQEDKTSGVWSMKHIYDVGTTCTWAYHALPTPIGQGRDLYFKFNIKYADTHEWQEAESKTAILWGTNRDNIVIFNLGRKNEPWGVPIPSSPTQAMPWFRVDANGYVRGDGNWKPPNDPNGVWFSQNVNTNTPVYVTRGRWYTVEIYVKVDGYGNGILRLWIDGQLVMDHRNLYTLTNSSLSYVGFQLGATLNQEPEGNYTVNVNSASYWDDVVISDTCNSCDQPSAQIINPTNSGTYTTTNTTINLSGTATDTLGTNIGITSVTWSNDRGGSGTASGTTNWSIFNVPLQSGQNIITVTATDGDGKTGTDALVVNLTSSGGSGSGSGGDSGGGSGGGGCGFVKNDGKGLKANGDMVAFAMMLIIMPTIFYLIKRGGMMRRFLP